MTRPVIEFHPTPRRHYLVNGVRVPSVTTVLGLLDKPGLPGWAAKVTAEGAWKLARRKGYKLPDEAWKFGADLKKFGYDHRSVSSTAAERGTAVHAVLENWINEQRLPSPNEYPEAARGYVRSLAAWLMEWKPQFLEAEKIVGSSVHGFAGTRDTVALLNIEGNVRRGVSGQRVMFDLKTSRRCYPETHFRQLAAYELAGVECGEEPTDKQAIIVLHDDGTFDVEWSFATADDFLNVLKVWRDNQAFKRAEKDAKNGR